MASHKPFQLPGERERTQAHCCGALLVSEAATPTNVSVQQWGLSVARGDQLW